MLETIAQQFNQFARSILLSFEDEVAQVIAHMLQKHVALSIEEMTADVKRWIDGEKPTALDQVVAVEIVLHRNENKDCYYQISCYLMKDGEQNFMRINYPEQSIDITRLDRVLSKNLVQDGQCLMILQ